jgi:hypothetical protein
MGGCWQVGFEEPSRGRASWSGGKMISISDHTIFIQYSGPVYPGLAKVIGSRNRLIAALTTHIAHNGRCRTLEYMSALAAEHGAREVRLVTCTSELPPMKRGAEVVLLWADANGIGCSPLERALKRSGVHISVLNGRRQFFELTPGRRRAMQCRRVMEKFLLVEVLFTILFFVITPALVVWDAIHGRR